ncbi:MAG: 2-amino-4-hydroxy-6-hydroxymethyldihydropteridine diphosphokinase [Bacteroidetes bacterium 4572_128]|nr:MAG: 2-amino-4-hydroxy-6-hydroxymethyldihydropteridine diphosphokinase [Bacteroidetes bacterium 4572_128]
MKKIYILLGGNLGDRAYFLRKSIKEISQKIGKILKKSSIYESKSWGFSSEKNFLNQVILINSNLSPYKLLECSKKIEKKLGRIKKSKDKIYENRTIDIDILFYENEIINDENLQIPHKLLHKRKFTILPLCEIAPKLYHPLLKKNIENILKDCKSNEEITIYN